MSLNFLRRLSGRFPGKRSPALRSEDSRLASHSYLTVAALIGTVLFLAAALAGVLGSRATIEWQKNAAAVVDRRADEVVALLLTALTRDMRGVQEAVLVPMSLQDVVLNPAHDISEIVAQAFARHPYPESFFVWTTDPAGSESAALFNRADRRPPWETMSTTQTTFPVTVAHNSVTAYRLSKLARNHVSRQDEFAIFGFDMDEVPYQVVAKLFFLKEGANRRATAVVGFTVNLSWTRNQYFAELMEQVEHIGGASGATALSLSVLDEANTIVAQTRPASGDGPVRERQFELAFFDPATLSIGGPEEATTPRWTARVSTADDRLLGAANAGARRTLIMIVAASAISCVGLLLAMRLLRANFELMAIKDDLITMMSHELKTPLASMTLAGEALIKGRASQTQIADYGSLIAKETARLNRLVENFLTFSRVASNKQNYKMTIVDVRELVDEAVERLQPQLQKGNFDVVFNMTEPVPPIYCDQAAIVHAFENVIENAIKYSGESKRLEVSTCNKDGKAILKVRDYGIGIPSDDLPYVFNQFFRARNARFHGSGLGLRIARKIIEDHSGQITVESIENEGTVVTLCFPPAAGTSR